MTAPKLDQPSIYQLRITLHGSDPPVWRRVHVRGDITLHRLHRTLQALLGWSGAQPHQFVANRVHYGTPDPEDERGPKSDQGARLNEVAPGPRSKLAYEYGAGESWWFEIVVEKLVPAAPNTHYPLCLEGERAAPPEDCGCPAAYRRLLQALRDPADPEHPVALARWGGSFDAKAFDVGVVNGRLRSIR